MAKQNVPLTKDLMKSAEIQIRLYNFFEHILESMHDKMHNFICKRPCHCNLESTKECFWPKKKLLLEEKGTDFDQSIQIHCKDLAFQLFSRLLRVTYLQIRQSLI